MPPNVVGAVDGAPNKLPPFDAIPYVKPPPPAVDCDGILPIPPTNAPAPPPIPP